MKAKFFVVIALLLLCKLDSAYGVNQKDGTAVFDVGTQPIGGFCNTDEDCLGYPESAICDQVLKSCDCRPDHEIIYPPPEGGPVTCAPVRQRIGDSCQTSAQCTRGEPGPLSDCMPSYADSNKLICNCTEGSIHEPNQHKCHPIQFLVGDVCEVNAQCRVHLTELSECKQKKCACSSGAVATDERDKCLPINSEIGQPCLIKEQCTLGQPGLLSDCLEPWQEEAYIKTRPKPKVDKICNCTDIAINEPGDHVCYQRRTTIGESCKVNAQCKVNMGRHSECDGNEECSCIINLAVPNTAETYCLPIVKKIGESCIESQQCTSGELGSLSVCRPSETDHKNLVCACLPDAINQPKKHKCHKKAIRVDDPCVEEAQCTANLGKFSECITEQDDDEGTCKCKPGSLPRSNRTYCLPIRNQLGETCSESLQCENGIPGQYSVCLDGKCQCLPGAINEPGAHVCKVKAELVGDKCEENSQCKANLGDLSECLRGEICICTPTYGIPNSHGNYCLPVINMIGGECLESTQCQNGVPGQYSECRLSNQYPDRLVCNCSEGSTHEPGFSKCYQIAEEVGNECDVSLQCKIKLGEWSYCSEERTCECVPDRAVPSQGNTKCLTIATTLGELCEENVQCTKGKPGSWSECRRADVSPYKDVCSCQSEAIPDTEGNVCYKTAKYVDDPCAFDKQCTENLGNLTACNNEGNCKCLTGAVPNLEGEPGTQCIPGGILIGKPCDDKAQCLGKPEESSICSSGICACLPEYTESTKLDNCLIVRNQIGDPCEEPQQCQQGEPGRLSECVQASLEEPDKFCKCRTDSISEAGKHKCHLKATYVGDPCLVGIQCVANLEFSQCLEGLCECLENNTASTDKTKCLQKKYLTEPCSDNAQCSHVENAYCKIDDDTENQGVCACSTGYLSNPSVPNTCIRMAAVVGDSCKDHDTQCDLVYGAICNHVNYTCDCHPENQIVSENKTKCLEKVPDLHTSCEEDAQCQVPNSSCVPFADPTNATVCMCKPNLFLESISTPNKCLQIVTEIGQTCEENQQCTTGLGDNTECLSNACRCSLPYESYEGKCFKPSKLNTLCSSNEECFLGTNNLTFCKKPEQLCNCLDTAFQKGDICYEYKTIGDPCQNNDECTVAIIGPSYCDTNSKICKCTEGHSSQYDGNICSMGSKLLTLNVLMFVFLSSMVPLLF